MSRASFRSPSKKKNINNNINSNIKISCRSPENKKIIKKPEVVYKIITETYSGEKVKVPTEDIKPSFIKFKTKSLPIPIKNQEKVELIKINSRKRYNFNEALSIYENNQSYYLDLIENNIEKVNLIIKDVEALERWFLFVKEPKPINEDDIEEWNKREQFKIVYGYSKYFDPTLLYYYCKIDDDHQS